jgi:CDP-diacylglycerol--serine O-phosphatidyltransferase
MMLKMTKLNKESFRIRFPDLITFLNLVAGVFAVYAAILGDTGAAVLLVVAAMLFDFFDGRVARFLKQEHSLGLQLDSLADMVSFGVAPGVIALVRYRLDYLVLGAAALYAVAGAYRLARFNLLAQSEERMTYFTGLPIPSAALVLLASLYLDLPILAEALLILVVAFLMAATFRLKKI